MKNCEHSKLTSYIYATVTVKNLTSFTRAFCIYKMFSIADESRCCKKKLFFQTFVHNKIYSPSHHKTKYFQFCLILIASHCLYQAL